MYMWLATCEVGYMCVWIHAWLATCGGAGKELAQN